MSKVTIIREFDDFEEQYELRQYVHVAEAYEILREVDKELRAKLKYGEDKWLAEEGVQDFLEHLREMISESGVLRLDE